jgi:hypothetical protein
MKAHRPYRHQPATRVISYDNAIWHSMPRYPGFRYQTYRRGYNAEILVLEGYRYGRCIYEGEAFTLNWAGEVAKANRRSMVEITHSPIIRDET